jgi:hypothetical protein
VSGALAFSGIVSAELDLLGVRLEMPQARAQETKAGAKIGHQRQPADIKAKRKAAQESLSRLNRAGNFVWGALQVVTNQAVGELRSALDQDASNLK